MSAVYHLAIWMLPVLLAITLHEVAHGWIADRLGDGTARASGRLSINPIAHLDPIGTVVVPAVLLLAGGVLFGWAKSVPVTPQNLRRHRYGMAWVAIAGPASNLLQAVAWAALLRLALAWSFEPLRLVCMAGVTINLVLAVLNLLPILPLDGGRIVESLLPPRLSSPYARLERFGLWIVLLLAITGGLAAIMGPPFLFLRHMLTRAFGLEALA